MRIISGSLRGRALAVSSPSIRPTASKLRGQVFNICQGGIEGGHALDLFAGSGAMGIEALSRGAAHCTFVENNRQAVLALKSTIHQLHLEASARILSLDVLKALSVLSSEQQPLSFVYIDPPYSLTAPLQQILEIIDTKLALASGGYVFLETRKNSFTPQPLSTLTLVSQRTSGDSELWHFETQVGL